MSSLWTLSLAVDALPLTCASGADPRVTGLLVQYWRAEFPMRPRETGAAAAVGIGRVFVRIRGEINRCERCVNAGADLGTGVGLTTGRDGAPRRESRGLDEPARRSKVKGEG